MNILGYARVSTQDQDLDIQKSRLNENGAIRIFDDVISGRYFERPGLDALMDYARAGDLVCIVRLDRLGRSLKELLEIVELFKEREIGLLSLEEKIDTSSAAGELIFHVFGAIAHFERRLISERTKEGIRNAKLKGKQLGRPTLDPELINSALKLIKAGVSPTNTAKQLGIGRSTLYREMKSRL